MALSLNERNTIIFHLLIWPIHFATSEDLIGTSIQAFKIIIFLNIGLALDIRRLLLLLKLFSKEL